MGLFGNKGFSPKKASPRKAASLSNLAALDATQRAQEFGLDYGSASLKLNGTQLKFEDGTWHADTGSSLPQREVVKLRKDNQKLLEENNMLKLKIDILLDMLSESAAECHILEKERDEALKTGKF
ncbi:protein chibby homolog 1-like [Styela clava]|uniref:protein chibby homolog 1-like n=1 Tax=Styela clava TaxID=7725 RepID=UPI0019393917|nr:protein chibby homolog 1-like [Styela clava]